MATKATKNSNVTNVTNVTDNVKNESKKISIKDIFSNLEKSGINLSLENSHRSVFKKELIENLTDTEQKTFRRKARKLILTFAETLCNAPTDAKVKAQFNELYKSLYAINDYTLQSICSDNMREKNKEVLKKALEIAKK